MFPRDADYWVQTVHYSCGGHGSHLTGLFGWGTRHDVLVASVFAPCEPPGWPPWIL